MAPSRTVLVGMPAVLTAIPPGRGCGSTTQTRLPKYAACAAPFSPAGPAPIHTQSYFAATCGPDLPGVAATLARDGSRARSARVLEQRAAHAGRERAHIDDRIPNETRNLVIGV